MSSPESSPIASLLEANLRALAEAGQLREPIDASPHAIVLCSNDYLGFADRPLASTSPAGAGASRLISGSFAAHREAERACAAWVGAEDALLFTSGYAANVGTLTALAGRDDVIVSDALNHASIIDGCRLSRATTVVVPHRDLEAVERALAARPDARQRWVVAESYYSMEGTSPDLVALRALADRHRAGLIVDEAHALGVFGPRGAGRCREHHVVPDVLIGTLGKSVGLQGAFVAGSPALRRWLWNRARSFVFSTGLSPALAAAVAPRLAEVERAEERRATLRRKAEDLRQALSQAPSGRVVAASEGPIVPFVVGDEREAVALRDRLLARGLFVQAIRPPTVPPQSSRLRITVTATTEPDALRQLADALGRG